MLNGKTISLGPLIASDAQLMFQWLNTPEITASNGSFRPTDGMDFTSWFQNIGKDRSRIYFAVRKAGDPRLLGYLTILNIHQAFRSAEMGVTIGAPADRGLGYGRESMSLGLDYCWKSLDLERVTLRIYGDNPAAIRCYQRAGFVLEGVLRGAAYLNGRRQDITMMGALRRD